MVDPNTRQGKRTPVTLKIKFKSETLEQFIERYAVDVSQGGIFIRTKEPLAVGTQMRFEFQLKDASPLIAGEGTVVWTRENDPSRPAIAPGMGVRFDKLADGSQSVLEKILSEKAKQAPVRPSNDSPTKPPMFTDTPTVVAPLAVQDALLGDEPKQTGGRKRPDSGKTPLPAPTPFHSDADEFPEEAFEEATKVRALDELIAQTAGSEQEPTVAGLIPEPDEEDLAQRARTASTISERSGTDADTNVREVPADRESAPSLPGPPAVGPRLLDTTPSPRADETSGKFAVPNPDLAKTKPGLEPAKAATASRPSTPTTPPLAVKDSAKGARPAADPPAKKMPVAPEQKSSMAPTIIMLLLLVAAGGAALWFFVLRSKAEEANKPTGVGKTNDGSGTAVAANNNGGGSNAPSTNPSTNPAGSGSDASTNPSTNPAGSGSAVDTAPTNGSGSAVATNAGSGSAAATNAGSGSAEPPVTNNNTGSGSAAGSGTEPGPATPASQVVDTYIASTVPGATVEVLGTRFSGNAPLRAKLERGKAYKARISAPGYVAQEIAFKGGDARPTAKLEPKPRSIVISSDPAGALIFIDNANSGFTTPYTLELKGPALTKKSVRITLRKNGHKTFEKFVDISAFKDDGAKMTATINEQLPVQVMVSPQPGGGNTTTPAPKPPTGDGGSGGSGATTPPPSGGTGDGPKDGPKEPAGGTSDGTPPKEPTPDFLK